VTVSVGASTFPDDATNREELIQRADQALYAAKRGGRNRAVAFVPSMAGVDPKEVEKRRVEGAEDEARRRVDRPALPV
jgi:predicted signal transduction protein with EAL and GGDEF domain